MGRAGRQSRGPGAVPLEAHRQEYAELHARGVSRAMTIGSSTASRSARAEGTRAFAA